MSDFRVSVAGVKPSVSELSGVSSVVMSQANVVSGITSNMGSIGLGSVIANVQMLSDSLKKDGKKVVVLSESLQNILKKYEAAENNITSSSVDVSSILPFADGDITRVYGHSVNENSAGDSETEVIDLTDKINEANSKPQDTLNIELIHPTEEEVALEYNKLITYDKNGNPIVKWDNMYEMIGKNPENISDAEYIALSHAYLNMKEEDLGRFISLCMACEYDSKNPEYSGWYADPNKFGKILYLCDREINADLALIMSDTVTDINLVEERDSAIQRKCLLQTFADYRELTTLDADGDIIRPQITVEQGYYDYNGKPQPALVAQVDHNGDPMFLGSPDKYYILEPYPGNAADNIYNDYNHKKFKDAYDGVVVDGITSNIISAASNLPVVGTALGVIDTGADFIKDYMDAYDNYNTAQQICAVDVLGDFDCSICYVIENDNVMTYAYVNADTFTNIENYNTVAHTNYTVDQLLENYELFDDPNALREIIKG